MQTLTTQEIEAIVAGLESKIAGPLEAKLSQKLDLFVAQLGNRLTPAHGRALGRLLPGKGGSTVEPLFTRSPLAEHMRIQATEYLARQGDPPGVEAWAKLQKTEAYEDYKASLAMGSNDATAGGTAVAETLSGDMIPYLRASSAVMRLEPRRITMPTGAVRQVKFTSGATAYYQGENKPATISQAKTGEIKLIFHKLTVLVPISNDLLRFAMGGAEDMIRQDALDAARTRGDLAFMRGSGLGDEPLGLRSLVASANVFSITGTTQATITADLAKAKMLLASANMPMTNLGVIMHPRPYYYIESMITANGVRAFPTAGEGDIAATSRAGLPKIETMPVAVSSQYPIDISSATTGYTGSAKTDILGGDFSQVVVGESMSIQMAVSTDGGYTDLAGVQQNAFQNDQTLMRLIMEHDIQVRYPQALFCIKDVSY